MRSPIYLVVIACSSVGLIRLAGADERAALRLLPFPKKIELQQGTFPLDQKLVLEAPAATAKLLGHFGWPRVSPTLWTGR